MDKSNTKKRMDSSATTAEEITAATDAAPAAKKLPLKTLRVEDCSASIWSRDVTVGGRVRTFFSVTFERSYTDRDGARKYTKSFDESSLRKLATLAQQSSEAIRTLRQEASEDHQ